MFNVFLLYQETISDNNFIVYQILRNKLHKKQNIIRKNENLIRKEKNKIDIPNNILKDNDRIEEIIKNNSNYAKKKERLIIIADN